MASDWLLLPRANGDDWFVAALLRARPLHSIFVSELIQEAPKRAGR